MHSHMQTSSGRAGPPSPAFRSDDDVGGAPSAWSREAVSRPCCPALSFPGPSELPAAHVVFQKPEHHPSSWLPLTLRDMAEAAPPR